MQNYYHLLGVSNFASFEEIAAAYKQRHSELFDSGSALANIPKLRQIKEAFDVLVDDEKREEYDDKLMEYLEDVNKLYNSAVDDLTEGNLQSSIEKINQCISKNPGEPDYYETLGLAYRLSGNLDQAVNAYKQGISTGQRKAFFHRYLADIYAQKHDEENADSEYLEAAESFKELLKTDPKNIDALEELADVYFHIRFFDESLDLYRQLIASHPYEAVYHRNAGCVLYEIEEYEQAEKYLLESLRLKPGDAAGLMFLGLVYFKRRLFGLALQTLKDCLEKNPDQPEVVQLIEQILSIRKQIGRTVEEITYDPVPDAYVEGTVKWYNPETGIGVLTCEELPEVLLHYTAVLNGKDKELKKGDAVKFGVVVDSQSPIAVEVEKIETPTVSDAMPGKIKSYDKEKKFGIIQSFEGKDVFFPFSSLTEDVLNNLSEGLDVLYEAKSITGLDDKPVLQAIRVRLRNKKK